MATFSQWAMLLNTLLDPYEGFSPIPYRDKTGKWTIGKGTTQYPDGRAVGPHDTPITLDQANEYRNWKEQQIDKELGPMFKHQPSFTQRAAIYSLAYNVGIEAVKGSTLLKKFNAGDFAGASREFPKWDHEKENGHEVEVEGLLKRRLAEQAMFNRHF